MTMTTRTTMMLNYVKVTAGQGGPTSKGCDFKSKTLNFAPTIFVGMAIMIMVVAWRRMNVQQTVAMPYKDDGDDDDDDAELNKGNRRARRSKLCERMLAISNPRPESLHR